MKLLVCGASGYIGQPLVDRARGRFDVLPTSSSGKAGTLPLDLAQPERFDYRCVGERDVVILAAAISAPDVCANERARALAVNVSGTGEFVERLLQRGARVIFLSSDTVYGQQSQPFDESAPCQPAGDYAQMKHEVEQRFCAEPSFKSLRLSYVFSRDDKFTRYLDSCRLKGNTAEVFDPFDRAVVHREDVIEAALNLAQQWDRHGQAVFNVGGPQLVSRVSMAQTLRDCAWPGLKIAVVKPGEDFFANRPRSILMRSPRLEALLGRPARTLTEAVALELDLT